MSRARPPRGPQSSWTRKIVQEESWDTRFHLGNIPSYDPLRDKHCQSYASSVTRASSRQRSASRAGRPPQRSASLARPGPARRPERPTSGVAAAPSRESSISRGRPGLRAQSAGRSARPVPASERARERIVLERAAKASQLLSQLRAHLEKTWAALEIPQFHRQLFSAKYFEATVHPNVLLQEADALAHRRAPVQDCIRCVRQRDELLTQLRLLEPRYADGSLPRAQAADALVKLCLDLRRASLAVVEAVLAWRGQVAREDEELPAWPGGPSVDGGGDNYLLAMKHDLQWLADSALCELLPFSTKGDPFLIYPSAPRANRRREAGPPVWSSTDALPRGSSPARKSARSEAPMLPLRKEEAVRVHAAEMAILDEAVAARLREQGQPAPPSVSPSPAPASSASLEPALSRSPRKEAGLTAAAPAETAAAPEPEPAKPPEPPQPPPGKPKARGLAGTVGEASAAATAGAQLQLTPCGVSRAQMEAELGVYLARVPEDQRRTNGDTAGLWAAYESGELQWFWLLAPQHAGGPGAGQRALGLVVFKAPPNAPFAQVLHLSSASDGPPLAGVIAAARAHIFRAAAVRGVRVTLWHHASDDPAAKGGFLMDANVDAAFKEARFRWFQLNNTGDGRRGQVMSSNRYDDDPPKPDCAAGLVLRMATVAALSDLPPVSPAATGGTSIDGTVLCAEALRHAKDAEDGDKSLPASGSTSSGHLDHVYTQLQLRGMSVPCARGCAGSWERVAEFAADKLEGLPSLEELREAAGGAAGTVACAVMHVVTHWPRAAGRPLWDGSHVCVELQGYATAPGWAHPILYLPTMQDDLFVVVVCGGTPSASQVAELLKANELEETPPVVSARLPAAKAGGIQVQASLRGDVGARDEAGMQVGRVAHAFELEVSEGIPMPGELLAGDDAAPDSSYTIAPPYTLALWHADLGDAGVPLVVAHVER